MRRYNRFKLFVLTVALLVLAICAAPARAVDTACQPVFDAMTKLAATPNHQFMTQTAAFNSKPESSEIITTASAMYVKAEGAWHMSSYNPQQQAAEMQQAAAAGKQTCQHVRDEVVAGEPTTLYNTQDKQEGGDTVSSQIWVSKTRGLPVKQTIDMDVGGKVGKSHADVRIDYANVQAPAGAK